MTAKLTFDDEFNNLSLWDGKSGTWDTTFWYDDNNSGSSFHNSGLNDQEVFVNANYGPTSSVKPWTANNGVLTLQAAPASPAISQALGGAQYTSGQINTYHSFSQEYGYFEMRAQLPAGKGMWPAFWLMPTDGSWPPELDVMEVLGNDPTKLYTTVHTNETGAHTQFDVNGGTTVADTSAGYHTYAVDWEADKITFYFDNKEVFQTATPSDMHKPMYMLANLTVGGNWPGPVDSSTPFPANYNIDYIRAYDSNPYTNGGALPTDGSSTPAPSGSNPAPSSPAPSSTVTTSTPAAPANPMVVSHGTSGADTLSGQADAPNHIRGWAGDDSIVGGTQFNDINGNKGADTIVGKSVVGDWLLGGQGNDSIDASASTGNNLIHGNQGADTLVGGSGSDTLRGGQGDDVIHAGSGNDWISGDVGNNTIYGGQGADVFHGGAGHDQVNGWHDGDVVQLDQGVTFTASQVNSDVHVALSNGGEIDLLNTQLNSLQSGWIIH